jgi:hypothetical protein
MAEASFLSASSTILANVRTWFNSRWTSLDFAYSSPMVSGLEPLLLEGNTTLGNCRIACATTRLVEVSGLSTANIPGTNYNASFRTCETRAVYITMPVDLSLSSKVLYYAMDQVDASSAVVACTTNATATFVLTVPFFSKGNEHTFRYDLLNASFNLSLSVVPPTITGPQDYVTASLATEVTNALMSVRNTFQKAYVTPVLKAGVGASVLKPLTVSFALPTLTKQLTSPNCTLSGPCDPCDKCCLCVARQICTDSCKGCPCMTCTSSLQVHELLFYILIGTLATTFVWKLRQRNKWTP